MAGTEKEKEGRGSITAGSCEACGDSSTPLLLQCSGSPVEKRGAELRPVYERSILSCPMILDGPVAERSGEVGLFTDLALQTHDGKESATQA